MPECIFYFPVLLSHDCLLIFRDTAFEERIVINKKMSTHVIIIWGTLIKDTLEVVHEHGRIFNDEIAI